MIKILITGANSYIGTSFENWMKNYTDYSVDTIDMIDGSWRKHDFSKYDVVFHVAGIAHSDTGKVSDDIKLNYYNINTDLTIDVANKAKSEGVKQFIFMSSIIVYGSNNEFITYDSKPNPDNFYGDSKLKADIGIHKLESTTFKVVSIRPPMIYGKGCKGNYLRLSKLSRKIPLFPDYTNERSMLHINNLCEFIRLIIENKETGYFYPQNSEYVKTTEMVKKISEFHGKKIYTVKIFNPLIKLFKKQRIVRKVFGNLVYDKSMSKYKDFSYCVVNFDNSIRLTEEYNEKSINACISCIDD